MEPTILFMEKISFSLKFFSGHFYGQSSLRLSEVPCLQRFSADNTSRQKVDMYKISCVDS